MNGLEFLRTGANTHGHLGNVVLEIPTSLCTGTQGSTFVYYESMKRKLLRCTLFLKGVH